MNGVLITVYSVFRPHLSYQEYLILGEIDSLLEIFVVFPKYIYIIQKRPAEANTSGETSLTISFSKSSCSPVADSINF